MKKRRVKKKESSVARKKSSKIFLKNVYSHQDYICVFLKWEYFYAPHLVNVESRGGERRRKWWQGVYYNRENGRKEQMDEWKLDTTRGVKCKNRKRRKGEERNRS